MIRGLERSSQSPASEPSPRNPSMSLAHFHKPQTFIPQLWPRSAGGEQLHCAPLGFFSLFFPFFSCSIPFHDSYDNISLLLLLVLYFTSVIKLLLSQPTSSTFFPNSPPHPTGSRAGVGGVRERLRGAWLLTGVKP